MVKLDEIFSVEYGNKLDLNKQELQEDGICFVNRSARSLGVTARIKKIICSPYPAGIITVALGGSILESFIQPEPFYTGQNVKILVPKIDMTFEQKLYYCICIKANAFRYSTFGREANITLNSILVPSLDEIPEWVHNTYIAKPIKGKANNTITPKLNINNWKYFNIENIFTIQYGKEKVLDTEDGKIPLVSSTENNNGVITYVKTGVNLFKRNKLTIAHNGSIGACFYQDIDFYATSDVTILSNPNLNYYIAIFIATIVSKEKYRFNYGRKWTGNRMKKQKIKLPATPQGEPDWKFMEDYIKSLSYTAGI